MGGGVEGKQVLGIRKKVHPFCQFYMVDLAIDVFRDCRDGSLGHVGLGFAIVKDRVTDRKLLLYLHFIENWHFAQPTHVRICEGVLRHSTFLTCVVACLRLLPCLGILTFQARHAQANSPMANLVAIRAAS